MLQPHRRWGLPAMPVAWLIAIVITAAAGLLPLLWQMPPPQRSGWTLLLLVAVLLVYRLRKALPFLRLTAVSGWRRVHAVLGLLLLVMLLRHIGSAWPDAPLERLVLALLVLASASGLLLAWQSRRLPRLLTAAGGNQLLDSIPQARAALQAEARERVLEVAGGPMEQPYCEVLAALLPGAGSSSRALSASPAASLSIAQRRELGALTARAADLDAQQRHQRGWRLLLTAHAAFSYALLLFVLVHLSHSYRLLSP